MGAHISARNVTVPDPRDSPGLVKTLLRHRVNMLPAFNTLFNGLLNDLGFVQLDSFGLGVSN